MENYTNYRKFLSKEELEVFTDFLESKNIPYKAVESKPAVDITFTGNSNPEFWLQILSDDFEAVDKLIEEEFESAEVDPDHYFNDFSEQELFEVLIKFEEWNKSDQLLAVKLLRNRGVKISDTEIEELRSDRISELEKPETVKMGWIIAGYVFALLGGFIAIIIGLSIANTKKTLPDGRKVFSFDRRGRFHARNILYLGVLFVVFWWVYSLSGVK
jgi:hypothetical protein